MTCKPSVRLHRATLSTSVSFGRNGNRVASLFNWVTQFGFEIEGIVLAVLIVMACSATKASQPGQSGHYRGQRRRPVS